MHPNNKFERNGIKKKLFNYYENVKAHDFNRGMRFINIFSEMY